MSTSTYINVPYENWRLSTRGIVYGTDKEKVIECYVNTNFAGGWDQSDANNLEKNMSRTGYLITYTGCPLLWYGQL